MKSPKNQLHATGITTLCKKIVFTLFLITSFCLHTQAQQLAFPSATGAGAYVTGGRGKPVYIVTNLNNSGTGSLRQAFADADVTDGGIITFAVSGTIELTSDLRVTFQNNLTIAGQTAPAGGITIVSSNANTRFEFKDVNNLIMRYIRFRAAFAEHPATEIDALYTYRVDNYIFDHCSVSWGTDENASAGNGSNYTWQRNLFAESNKTGMIMGAEEENSDNMSFLNNAFYNCSHRFPNWQSNGRVDVINNVIWGYRGLISSPLGTFNANHIGNYYEYFRQSPTSETYKRMMYYYRSKQGNNMPSIYTSGNYVSDILEDPTADNWLLWRWRYNPSGTTYSGAGNDSPLSTNLQSLTPFPMLGESFVIKSYAEAFNDVVNDVGADARLDENGNKIAEIDDLDTIYLSNMQSQTLVDWTQSDVMNTTHRSAFLSSISQTPINTHPANFDTNNDGIPDQWVINKGFGINDDLTTHPWLSGYVGIEEYLNGVDETQGTNGITANAGNDVSICDGNSATLTASGGVTYQWNTGATTASIEVNPNTTTTYTVTAFDGAGTNSDTDDVTVTVNALPVANAGNDIETCQGTAVTLTANGGTSYLWNTGATTQSIFVNPNATTTYSVEVIQNGCSSDLDEVIVTVNPLPNVDAGFDISINFGDSTVLTAIGADSYVWNTGESTQSITVSPTVETTYSVTGTTGTCLNTDSVTVFIVGSEVVASAGNDQTICNGFQATLTATGGAAYVWNTGETTASINVSPTSTTTYTVTAFDNSGTVSDTDDVLVTVDALPTVDAGIDVTITNGESTTLTAIGANTYLWNTGETAQSIDVNPTSTITYSVTGFSNDCEATDDVTVTVELETIVANAGVDVTICAGESTVLTASGGTTYEWNTGETTASINVSPTTTISYIVTAFDSTGTISDTDDVIVTVDALPSVDAGIDVTITNGESTTLTATGANTYLWNTGETTQSIDVNPTSTITYSVTGFSNGCEATDDVTVTVELETIVANAGVDVTICSGESTVLTASGGTTYEWNTGETTASIEVSPTTSTSYIVTAFNASGTISDADVVLVTVNALPTVDAGIDVTITNGESTTLTATGANTYLWNTGETTSSIDVNPESTITYTVTGFSNGCEATDDVTVTVELETIVANAGIDVTICAGESTVLTASGGTTYEWNTGETTASIEVSPTISTSYVVTAFNASGTISDADVVLVTVNALPTVDAGIDVTITNGESTTLTATGANTYLWNTGETTQSIDVNPTSTITYSVTGFSNGCEAADDVTVTVELETIVANAGIDVIICAGESTVLTASGGTTYEWNTGETTASIEVSPTTSTSYIVTAFNASGTISDADVVLVTVNALPTVDAGIDVTITDGESTTLTATGANTYLWNTGETTSSIDVNPESTITYTVTGFANGCEASDDVTVTVETEFVNANAGDNVSICAGESTVLTATGGTTYQWNTGETTASIEVNPSTTTTYTVTAFNALGTSSDTDDVTVTINSIPVANAGNDVEICQGSSATLTASGGASYLWSTGETSQNIIVNPNTTTTYSVEVIQNNCSSVDEVSVTVNNLPNVNAGSDVTIIEGESITLTASGADTYLWNTGETSQTINVNPLVTTLYSVTGFSNGCEASDEVLVTVDPFVFVANAGEDQFICEDTSTTLTASEGDSYLWNTGETTQSIVVSPWASETFTVTVFEGDEQAQDDVTVFVNLNPNVVIMNGGEVTILEGEFITLSANGANTYEWDNGATQPNIAVNPSSSTTYSVTGYINSCSDEKSITVNVVETVEAYAGEDLTICANEMVTLTAIGGEDYLWNTGEVTQSINVTPGEDTEYSVLVYNALSSDEATVMVFVNDCSSAVIPEADQAFDFLIYQDVNADVLKVKISGMDRVDVDQLVIYDITGKIIYREQIKSNESTLSLDKEINSSQFSRGIYIVRLIYDDTEILKKIPIR
ncbi:T9SS type A sorting domain-containing protein [Psychroserpens jangbogonensis]|uniref:T9SS type A sorting domain-containing protein n=1 Tax=Psychroserpens jangbogonensis TaxID=1484460 RepID=UPI00053D823C|nr:T9SS type A sorting domain-containing protein [Psychroserpens jangbogonensis]